MYKTVRHGENSLQYKILAQQEEGIPNVKRKKPTREKTAGLIIVVLLLVCGVIATAVLVPLVLTNDFITLTGTFQKFSVSSLRRSHSGNHVVVVARKPHGWNSSRQNVLPPPLKASNASSYLVHNEMKQTTINVNAITTNPDLPEKYLVETTPHETITRRTTTTVASTETSMATKQSGSPRNSSTSKMVKYSLTSVPPPVHPERDLVSGSAAEEGSVQQSPLSPSPHRYRNQEVNLEPPPSLIGWSKDKIYSNALSPALGGVCAVAVIIVMIIVLIKSLPNRNRNVQNESGDSKEDVARLLKSSARASDEE